VLKKHIIVACMALHNFICDIQLRDKVFGECDANEEYLRPEPSAMAMLSMRKP
jgi:hypothetical protein